MNHYESLLAHVKATAALRQIQGLLSWDQETFMPEQGTGARAEQCAVIESIIHERQTDPRLQEWLNGAGTPDDRVARVNLYEVRRQLERARLVPNSLVAEIARVTASAQGVWAEARKQSRFADFAPTLQTIVTLKREQAKCLAQGGELYQALLEDFEPGAKVGEIAAIFGRLRPRLSALLAKVNSGDTRLNSSAPAQPFHWNTAAQMTLAQELAGALGYDFTCGRLDLSVHPFTSGQARDVRITTRVRSETPFDCLYSTIHEVGHALYEQGISRKLEWMPAGESASMGVHESQSRLWENQIGRSRAFSSWLYPRMAKAFDRSPYGSPEELYLALNRVEASYIRTEADEVTYNLHIILRFELERALIAGDLSVTDVEGAWNERFQKDFGIKVPEARLGVLQDIHWAAGLFGYFPTYALGNIYAGELYAALGRDLPNLETRISAGDFAPILCWLRKNVHEHGRLYAPTELIARAIGRDPNEEALLGYLEAKHA